MEGKGGGTLRVHGSVTGNGAGSSVILHFDDEGDGFAAVDRVFEPFYTTKSPGRGTGLGLALVHLFVHGFGGSVEASNRPEGGARVTLRLPVAPEAAEFETERPPALRPHPAPEAAVPSAPLVPTRQDAPSRERRPRILVVDDERPVRTLQLRILQRIGYDAVEAASAEEARRAIQAGAVDAVVSDVRMPGESGIDLYRWLQAEDPELAAHFLFVTGDMTHPELASLQAERPGAVILKPFSMEDYRHHLERALRQPR
jgi:CheY-like chemotaxis protein